MTPGSRILNPEWDILPISRGKLWGSHDSSKPEEGARSAVPLWTRVVDMDMVRPRKDPWGLSPSRRALGSLG